MAAVMMPPEVRAQTSLGVLDHKVKLAFEEMSRIAVAWLMGGTNADLASVVSGLPTVTAEDNLAKQRGLYVDYRDGHVRTPADVTPAAAKKAVARLRAAIKAAPQLTDAGFHQHLLQPDSETVTFMAAVWARFAAVLQIDDDAEAVSAFTEFFADARRAVESGFQAAALSSNPEGGAAA
jgi:hypothetical protein